MLGPKTFEPWEKLRDPDIKRALMRMNFRIAHAQVQEALSRICSRKDMHEAYFRRTLNVLNEISALHSEMAEPLEKHGKHINT